MSGVYYGFIKWKDIFYIWGKWSGKFIYIGIETGTKETFFAVNSVYEFLTVHVAGANLGGIFNKLSLIRFCFS